MKRIFHILIGRGSFVKSHQSTLLVGNAMVYCTSTTAISRKHWFSKLQIVTKHSMFETRK